VWLDSILKDLKTLRAKVWWKKARNKEIRGAISLVGQSTQGAVVEKKKNL